MWNEETDILEALEEYNDECESADDFSDLELDSDIAEDAEEETSDKDSEYVDYDD